MKIMNSIFKSIVFEQLLIILIEKNNKNSYLKYRSFPRIKKQEDNR